MQGQLKPIYLGALTFAAGGTFELTFKKALSQLGGRIPHVRKVSFHARATPTLSSGTMTAEEAQAIVKTLTIRDGVRSLCEFTGGFKTLRAFEMLERGKLFAPEPDAAATTEQVNFVRTYDLAPPLIYDPSDFLQPLAIFQNGIISGNFGALTDIDANCTAMTCTIDVYVWVTILDDFILGSLLERKEQTINSAVAISREAMYLFLALAKTSAIGAISAGDLANIKLTSEAFQDADAIDVRTLLHAYYEDMQTGPFSQVQGEPRAATDDNAKQPNGTAIAAPTANLQPILQTPKDGRLSKTVHYARPNLTVEVGGTTTNPWALMTRILPRTTDWFGQYMGLINNNLPVDITQWSMGVRGYKDKAYVGPRKDCMPLKFRSPQKKAA